MRWAFAFLVGTSEIALGWHQKSKQELRHFASEWALSRPLFVRRANSYECDREKERGEGACFFSPGFKCSAFNLLKIAFTCKNRQRENKSEERLEGGAGQGGGGSGIGDCLSHADVHVRLKPL